MDPNVKLVLGQGEPLRDQRRYQRLIGKLNYLTITRPNIFFPVSLVNQFLQSPCDNHWDATVLFFFLSIKNNFIKNQNREETKEPRNTQDMYKGAHKHQTTAKQKRPTQELPTPQPSEKIYYRVCVIITMQISPRPQICYKTSFGSLSIRNLVLKHQPISSTPDIPKQTQRGCQPYFFALFAHGCSLPG